MQDSFKEEEEAKAKAQILEIGNNSFHGRHEWAKGENGTEGSRCMYSINESMVEERFKEKEAKTHHTSTDVGNGKALIT